MPVSVFSNLVLFFKKNGHDSMNNDFMSLCNCERVNIRHAPNRSSCFVMIKNSLLSKEDYISPEETLHEYFYSLFPCVPHITAMEWISKGNPMNDMTVIKKNDPSGHMFSLIIDSKSYIGRVSNPSTKRIDAVRSSKTTKGKIKSSKQ